MWLHLSFDSIIIISWTNGITKIPRVTTTSNIKPIHGHLCLSFFVADLLTLLNKMVLFMTLAFFCFSFASFFLPENEREFILNKKKTQCKTIRCKKFEIHSVHNVTNAWSTSKWNKTRHIDLWTKEHWPSDLLITTSSNML